ncbi:MAG: hypothetical protein KF768_06465 [Phycisphaeraceae bacterium]|nr:hypothetical protein [Phycisphaeraceae bacterium]
MNAAQFTNDQRLSIGGMAGRGFARVAVWSALACLGLTGGSAIGQVVVSGLVHSPLGDASLSVLADDPRALLVTGIGAGGPGGHPVDGVSIHHDTVNGLACDIDLRGPLTVGGAACRVDFSDKTPVIKGSALFTNAGSELMTIAVDFSPIGSPNGVSWVMHDLAGKEVARGQTAVLALACTAGVDHLVQTGGGGLPPGPTPAAFFRIGSIEGSHGKGIRVSLPGGVFRIGGLTTVPVEGVHAISFGPIICITEPCPTWPGGWNTISSMHVTAASPAGTGDGTLLVRNAATTASSRARKGDAISLIGFARHAVPAWGTAGAVLGEPCAAAFPPGCDWDAVSMVVSHAPGQESGVVLDMERSLALCCGDSDGDGREDRMATVVSVSATATYNPAGGGTPVLTVRKRGFVNDAALLDWYKFEVRPDPVTGRPSHLFDASSRGASSALVEAVSETGVVVGSTVVGPDDPVTFATCGTPGSITYIGTCDAEGRLSVLTCDPSTVCIFHDGTAAVGVHHVVFSPLGATEPAGPVARCEISGTDLISTAVSNLHTQVPVIWGGRPTVPLGGASVSVGDSGELVVGGCCLGSSGEDGVEIRFDSAHGAGVCVDLKPLLDSPAAERGITISTTHVEYQTTNRVHIQPVAGGGFMEMIDLSEFEVVSFSWRALSPDRVELASGTIMGPVAVWTITPSNPAAATLNKCYWRTGGPSPDATSTALRPASQGFFDIVSVSGLAPAPIGGVAYLEYTPERCPLCPPPPSESTGSIRVQAKGVGSLHLSRAVVGMEITDPTGVSPPSRARCEGLGRAVVVAHDTAHLGRSIKATGLGSSGEDGVLISFFEPGANPPPSQVSFGLCGSSGAWSWGETNPPTWPAGGGGGGGYTARFGKSHELTGHVTLMKFEVLPDPASPNPVDQYFFDATGRGSLTATGRLEDGNGVEISSHVIDPTTPIRVEYCTTHPFSMMSAMPELGVDQDGGSFLTLPNVTDACYSVSIGGGTPVTNARRVKFTPIAPTVPYEQVTQGIVTGTHLGNASLGNIRVSSGTISPPCPGDFNDDGVVDLADLLDFLGAWNPSLGQNVPPGTGGDINGDGVVDLADLLDFLGAWNPNLGATCP